MSEKCNGVLRRIVSLARDERGYTLRFDCGHNVRRKLSTERILLCQTGFETGFCPYCRDVTSSPLKPDFAPLPVAYHIHQDGGFWTLSPWQWYQLCEYAVKHDGCYTIEGKPRKTQPQSVKGKDYLFSEDASRPLKRPMGNSVQWFRNELYLSQAR